MNECDPNSERRCSDGQCVDDPRDSNKLAMICAEAYFHATGFFFGCFVQPKIRCEIQRCPPLFFSCGDGYCYDGPSLSGRPCYTQRDQRYLQQMPSSSSLILYSHVIVHYIDTQPQYICFNQSLCPYLSAGNDISIINHQNLTCRAFHTFTNQTYKEHHQMIIDLKRLLRSCSLLPLEYDNRHDNCSIFRCNDGSKCLSSHRISDGFIDCANGEDENQLDVCSRNLSNRFVCDNGTKCLANSLVMDDAVSNNQI